MFKKILLILSVLIFTFSFSQKNKYYVRIDFSSICCGPPSAENLQEYFLKYQKENKLQKFEIWTENGLGDEGEYALYIGVDQLIKNSDDQFWNGINTIVNEFSKTRNENQDGVIKIHESLVFKAILIQKQKNPTTEVSKMTLYKY